MLLLISLLLFHYTLIKNKNKLHAGFGINECLSHFNSTLSKNSLFRVKSEATALRSKKGLNW